MGIYYATFLLGGVAQAYKPTTWRPKQEDCQQFEASLSYSMKSHLKLTKSKRWGVCGGQVTTCGRLLLSFCHAKFQNQTQVIDLGDRHLYTLSYFVCPCTFLYIYVWICQKDKVGDCVQPSIIPVLDGQWGILRVSWQVWIQLRTPASMNRAENNWGRCTCTHMDPYMYQHSRHVYMGKTCIVGIWQTVLVLA